MQSLITLHADIEKGFGQFTGALVMLIATQGFKGSLQPAPSYAKCTGACHLAVDKMWRVLIGKFLVSGRI
jgi:PHS family inorganic phosphate transporter-like MFS transporter